MTFISVQLKSKRTVRFPSLALVTTKSRGQAHTQRSVANDLRWHNQEFAAPFAAGINKLKSISTASLWRADADDLSLDRYT
jgi:hypothetical protein